MLGFVNGLAIVIGLAQLEQFKSHDANGDAVWISGALLNTTLMLIALTMVLIWLTPRITKLIPAPLVAIGVVTGLVLGFDIDVPRIGDLASLEGGLPQFAIPMVPLTMETLTIIFPLCVDPCRYRADRKPANP